MRPMPPIPPTERIDISKRTETRVETSGEIGECGCGGTVNWEKIGTGRWVADRWDSDIINPRRYRTEIEREMFDIRVYCSECGLEQIEVVPE